jgi:hypothetical protein
VRPARRLEVGLIEEAGRRWGGGERLEQRRSGGGRLRQGGGGLGGDPAARGEGEGELRALRRSGKKSTMQGEFRPAASDSTLLKGGDGTQWRGAEESNGVWRAKRGRGGRSRKWLRRSTSGPDRWARAAALPRDSGGRRDVGDTGARG